MADRLNYPEWKAPKEDGQIVVWPEAGELLRETGENQRRLSGCEARVQGVALREVRAAARGFLGHEDGRPLIATGHQAELHHPGVWVKNVLMDAVAGKVGGEAYHLAVDTDEPKHLVLRWPGGAEALTDDAEVGKEDWSGLTASPTPGHLAKVEGEFAAAARGWDFEPVMPGFFASMRRLSIEPAPLPQTLTNAVHELDWSLGLRHHALLASPVWMSPAFLLFAHHLLSGARSFVTTYNAVLDEYRAEKGIRTPGRPMPDLKVSASAIEVPFWLDDLASGSRARATIAGDCCLHFGGETYEFCPKKAGWEAAGELAGFLRRHSLRLSPRALTLTMFLRLFVADQFVHGIGGGRYDQLTDRIVERHFGIEPPRFSVTTGTLYFPEAAGRARACVPCVVQEGHRLKHGLLGARKRELVSAIAAAPRRSLERRELFSRMHGELANAIASGPAVLASWEARLAGMEAAAREDQVLFDRELFYAIQPRERLEGMIGRYRGLIGGA